MTESQFRQYCAEVRRLGRLPKPVIVRAIGDRMYEIIDGEHGWRAAQEVGLTEVDCEIVEIDDFDARRETFKRNRGGKDQKVKLARMFREMQKLRHFSTRKLAKEIKVSEGTLRNMYAFADAADLRNTYAGESRDDEISKLTLEQVRTYLSMPPEMRDLWLDAGGDICLLHPHQCIDVAPTVVALRRAGALEHLRPGCQGLRESIHLGLQLGQWAQDHATLRDVRAYTSVVARLALLPWVLDRLPCRRIGDDVEATIPADR
jgi:hypothetical protein